MLKVAIIDDEYYFRQSLKSIIPWEDLDLELCGEANNGEDALELIQDTKPDLALVDINMPIIDGIELSSILKEKGIPTKIIIITGYSEFEYAQKAIRLGVNNYLLKPIVKEELITTITIIKDRILLEKKNTENIAQILRNRLLKRLLKGNISDEYEDLLQYAESINLNLNEGEFQVIILDINNKDNIENEIFELFIHNTDDLIPAFVLIDDSDLSVLILQIPDSKKFDNKYIKHSVALVGNDLKEKHHCLVAGGIGRLYNGPDGISLSYNEALIALKKRMIIGNQSVILFEEENENKLNRNLFSLEIKQSLFRELRIKNDSEVKALVKNLFSKLKEQKANEKLIRIYAYNLMLCAIEFCNEFEQLQGEIEEINNTLIDIEGITQIEELEVFIFNKFFIIMKSLSDLNDRKSDNLIYKMKAYILENVFDSLFNIQMISDHFSMNYHYTCSLFKNETGQTINDFITEIRMMKAKEYLKQEDQNVSSVAFLCGYRDQYYFSRVFKKYFGLPPSKMN